MTYRVSPWKSLLIIPSAPHNKNSVSSRGWRSSPRDLTPTQALARYNRRVLRFRRDGPLCDLIAAGGPSPSPRLGMTEQAATLALRSRARTPHYFFTGSAGDEFSCA